MITLKSCPVCKSKNIGQYPQTGIAPIVTHEIMPAVFVDAALIARYFLCQNCHVIFQNPRMSDEELDKFYTDGFYRRLINVSDEKKEMENMMYWAKFHSKIIKENFGKVNSHLDVGCGRGYHLIEVGAKIKIGVEPDSNYVAVAGIDIFSRMNQMPQKSFDLVTAIHTLEHVPDPKSFLTEMMKKISKNGHLVIEVPTWKSPGGPLRLPHLFHFEPDVLRLLCREIGLHVLETKFTPHLFLICKLA